MKSHAAAHALTRHHARRKTDVRTMLGTLVDHFFLLPVGAAIALVWAKTAPECYFAAALPLACFVKEIGMAFFFALMTQEVVEAMMPGGALHSWRRWSLALLAAAGGIIGSATTFFAFVNLKYETLLVPYWPIACAVDMAAAYYTLKLILPRSGALPFALLLGIATNAFGVLIVATRHPVLDVHAGGVALIVAALGLAATMRFFKV